MFVNGSSPFTTTAKLLFFLQISQYLLIFFVENLICGRKFDTNNVHLRTFWPYDIAYAKKSL